jgi:hypothetical protein
MGNTEKPYKPGNQNFREAVFGLQDASTLFVTAWAHQRHDQATRATNKAVDLVHIITGENRLRVIRGENLGYDNPRVQAIMESADNAQMLILNDPNQIANAWNTTPGHGSLPEQYGQIQHITFERLLNKLRHRDPSRMNFRIEDGRHLWFICPYRHQTRDIEGIVKFDVGFFCEKCLAIEPEFQ